MMAGMTNEAAERLRTEMEEGFNVSGRGDLLDKALLIERRIALSRVRVRVAGIVRSRDASGLRDDVMSILDYEADERRGDEEAR